MKTTYRNIIALLFLFCCASVWASKPLTMPVGVVHLTAEHLENPMSLDTARPRLGWQIRHHQQDVMQTSAHIIVASSKEKAEALEGDLWDYTLKGDQSQWVTYEGKELRSNTRCYWRVKVETTRGSSEWSEVNEWNVGLLNECDWSGVWIGWDRANEWDVEDVHSRLSSRYLREEFKLDGFKDGEASPVKRATLYISGLGLYEAYINGRKVGDDVLAPAPTDYRKTVLYNAYDVTDMLAEDNAIGVVLGNGRYYTMQQKKKAYKIANFGYPKLRANLVIEYTDGKRKTIATSDKWRLNMDGAIRSNNEYDGEVYDARKEFLNPATGTTCTVLPQGTGGWTTPGFDDSAWLKAERCAIPSGTLRGMMQPGMKELQLIDAKDIKRVGGKFIVDFGQNMSGWAHININNVTKGDSVIIRYAEKLDSTGTALWVDNLRHAQSTDVYIANGTEKNRLWHAIFSYHGFRYVEVSGLKQLEKNGIRAALVADNLKETGTFSTNNETLNKVFHNAKWGVLTNYKGMPVDCPQRDERQPWLGDRTAGSLGESYLFDNLNLYAKWSRDIVESQREDGVFCDVAPAYWNYYNDDVTWPAALPMSLEMLYDQYGDDQPVRKHYPAVVKWLRHVKYQYGQSGLIEKDKYGDWCVPPESQELIHSQDPARQTDGTLISSAYYYRLCKWVERFAKLQGLSKDAEEFAKEAEAIKKAFNEKFLTVNRGTSLSAGHLLYPDSTFYGNNSATANILPYYFDMIGDAYVRGEVEKNILDNIITKNGGHISTGVIGTSWLMRSLIKMGRGDVAWLLATNKTYPSWGYMAEQGATTTWELWNGDTANPAMNSGNHVMLLGDLVTWMFQNVGGIRPVQSAECRVQSAGYKEFILWSDYRTDEVDDIKCSYNSIYGEIVSNWHKAAGKLYWHIQIPANTKAYVYMPTGEVKEMGSGVYDLVLDMPSTIALRQNLRAQNEQPLLLSVMPKVIADEWVYAGPEAYKNLSPRSGGAGGGLIPYSGGAGGGLFPECHSATITETQKGDLVATYFGGTKERNPDCCIWVSRKPKDAKEWSAPILAADGVFKPEEFSADPEVVKREGKNGEISVRDHRKALWNPIIFQNPKSGLLEIYFKMGLNVKDWTGWIVRSKDGGKTWGKRSGLTPLTPSPKGEGEINTPADYYAALGPVKNKIFVLNTTNGSRLIAPTSLENGQWRLYFEISDDYGKTWHRTADVEAGNTPAPAFEAGKKVNAIQPAILDLGNGKIAAVARTRSEHVAYTESSDNGETWSTLELLDLPNNNSGLDAVTLSKPMADGYKHVMICNDHKLPEGIKNGKGLRTPLSLVRSKDGKHWEHWVTLEDSPISQYSYPSIIQTKDGHLHCIYTWRRQRIKHVELTVD